MSKRYLITVLFLLFVSPVSAADQWLLGKWETTGKNHKEGFVFKPGGKVDAIGKSGKVTPGTYAIEASDVKVELDLKVMKFKVTLRFPAEKNKLILYSKEKGDVAEYRKL